MTQIKTLEISVITSNDAREEIDEELIGSILIPDDNSSSNDSVLLKEATDVQLASRLFYLLTRGIGS